MIILVAGDADDIRLMIGMMPESKETCFTARRMSQSSSLFIPASLSFT